MSRLMSVAHTMNQVYNRTKTQTRRVGWWEDAKGRRILKPGDTLTLCEKVMGRKKGEPLVRIVDVRVLDVRRERLDTITQADVVAEGFPAWNPAGFVKFFCETFGGTPDQLVTRIEWSYIEPPKYPSTGDYVRQGALL